MHVHTELGVSGVTMQKPCSILISLFGMNLLSAFHDPCLRPQCNGWFPPLAQHVIDPIISHILCTKSAFDHGCHTMYTFRDRTRIVIVCRRVKIKYYIDRDGQKSSSNVSKRVYIKSHLKKEACSRK